MNSAEESILTINGGSSSIKFALISAESTRVRVRVIRTNEELVIARSVFKILERDAKQSLTYPRNRKSK